MLSFKFISTFFSLLYSWSKTTKFFTSSYQSTTDNDVHFHSCPVDDTIRELQDDAGHEVVVLICIDSSRVTYALYNPFA